HEGQRQHGSCGRWREILIPHGPVRQPDAAIASRPRKCNPFPLVVRFRLSLDGAALLLYVRPRDTPPHRGAPIWKDRTMAIAMPAVRPAVPHFSSGPCAKRPGWSLQSLTDALLGRSHRSKIGRAKLKRAIELTREVLEVPADYRIGIVPASDTGAVEMALWSLLGARPVTMLAWESFGEGWVSDVSKELKLKNVTVLKAGYGELPDLARVDPASDVVFTWNGTTSGVRVPNADWIKA